MKRERYQELEFWCNDCGIAFEVEGHIEPLVFPDFEIVTTDGKQVRCPNDIGVMREYIDGVRRIPTHDVNYAGG